MTYEWVHPEAIGADGVLSGMRHFKSVSTTYQDVTWLAHPNGDMASYAFIKAQLGCITPAGMSERRLRRLGAEPLHRRS